MGTLLNRRRYMGGKDKYFPFIDNEVWRRCCLAWGDYYQYTITDNGDNTVKIVTRFVSKSYKTNVINKIIDTQNSVDNSQGTYTAGTFYEPIGITLEQMQAVQYLYNINVYDEKFQASSIVHFPELQYFTGLTDISNYAFKNCSYLEDVIIPVNVTKFGTDSFRVCPKLSSIVIKGTVTSYGANCFQGDTSLESYTFQEGVTSIPYQIFRLCSALKTVSIPSTVTHLNGSIFLSCNNLQSVIILATTPPTMNGTGSASAFNDVPNTLKIYVPDNSVNDYKNSQYTYWTQQASKIYPLSELPT